MLLLASLLLTAVQDGGPAAVSRFEPTQADLDAVTALALPLVEDAVGVELEHPVRARLSTRAEIEEVLVREARRTLARRGEGAERIEDLALQNGRVASETMLAKLSLEDGVVHVSPETIRDVAELVDVPELVTLDALRAVVVHELVHVVDQAAHDYAERVLEAPSADELLAFNALIEGHAQHVARRVCAELGWSEGFEVLTRALTAAGVYADGEAFVVALEQAGGREAIARAFARPPTDLVEVRNPGWYLDPDSRPASAFDLAAAARSFRNDHPEDRWDLTLPAEDRSRVEPVFALRPADEARAILEGLRATYTVATAPSEVDRLRTAAATIHEWGTDAEARAFVAEARALHRAQDRVPEARIAHARYEDVRAPDMRGFVARKRIYVLGSELRTVEFWAASGPLSVHFVWGNRPGGTLRQLNLARRMFLAARGGDPEPVPGRRPNGDRDGSGEAAPPAEEGGGSRGTPGGAGG